MVGRATVTTRHSRMMPSRALKFVVALLVFLGDPAMAFMATRPAAPIRGWVDNQSENRGAAQGGFGFGSGHPVDTGTMNPLPSVPSAKGHAKASRGRAVCPVRLFDEFRMVEVGLF